MAEEVEEVPVISAVPEEDDEEATNEKEA